ITLPPWHEDFINSVLIGSLSIRETQRPRLADLERILKWEETALEHSLILRFLEANSSFQTDVKYFTCICLAHIEAKGW
ncbi:hypothetical protein LEMLEM_LOCUS10020, partial [Lemmus lemmus]